MADGSFKVTCRQCRDTFSLPSKLRGKSGKCPTCDATITYGKAKTDASKAKVHYACEHCGHNLILPAKALGKVVACTNCKKKVKVTKKKARKLSADDESVIITDSGQQDKSVSHVKNKKADNAWENMQRLKEDSYWVAQWKSILYPFKAIGALVFFVVGMPLTIATVEILAKFTLTALATDEGGTFQSLTAGVVTAISLFAVLAMFSFFASFLFALVRVSAEGRSAAPVITGMNHKANVSTFVMWLVAFSAPGLMVAYASADENEIFKITIPVMIIWIVSGLIAPLGLLCTATLGGVQGINPARIFSALGKIGREYGYFLLVFVLGSAIFIVGSVWSWQSALAAFDAKPPKAGVGFVMRLISGLLLMFPMVIATRGVGMILKYSGKKLPFRVDTYAEQKSGPLPLAMAFLGVLLMFVPLYRGAQNWMHVAGQAQGPWAHMELIHRRLANNNSREVYPKTYEELERAVPALWLKPPDDLPEPIPSGKNFYEVVPLTRSDKKEGRMLFVRMYTSVPVAANGAHFAMLLNGRRKKWHKEHLDNVLKAMEEYYKADPRDQSIRDNLRQKVNRLASQ